MVCLGFISSDLWYPSQLRHQDVIVPCASKLRHQDTTEEGRSRGSRGERPGTLAQGTGALWFWRDLEMDGMYSRCMPHSSVGQETAPGISLHLVPWSLVFAVS
jgi:hypothetical protein